MKLLQHHENQLREHERLSRMHATHQMIPINISVLQPDLFPLFFPGPSFFHQSGCSRIRPLHTSGGATARHLDDGASVLWRLVLSYLNWEELKEVTTLVSLDWNTLSRLVWWEDCQTEKKWINMLEFMSRTLGTADVTATSCWNDTSDENPHNVIDGNPMSWWSSKQLDEVTLMINFAPRIIPLNVITIFWGDDGGRIREFVFKLFTLSVSTIKYLYSQSYI